MSTDARVRAPSTYRYLSYVKDPGIRIRLDPSEVALEPGIPAVINAEVFNGSPIVDEFAVDVVGIDPRFVSVEPARIALFPSAAGNTTITIEVTSPYLVAAGRAVLGVRARSATNRDASIVEELSLNVLPLTQVVLELHPESIRRGRTGAYVVVARNMGNAAVDIALRGSDPEGEVSFAFAPETHSVPPGEEVWSIVQVKARRPFMGNDLQRAITITAATPDPDAELITSTGVFV